MFSKCKNQWCKQNGPTKPQYTMCESVTNNGNTCVNPQIKYGTTTGGIPKRHGNMDTNMKTWCQQLGGVYVSHTLGPRSGFALFPCKSYDEKVWHWCDWRDGLWYNSALNHPITSDSGAITGITCKYDGSKPEPTSECLVFRRQSNTGRL